MTKCGAPYAKNTTPISDKMWSPLCSCYLMRKPLCPDDLSYDEIRSPYAQTIYPMTKCGAPYAQTIYPMTKYRAPYARIIYPMTKCGDPYAQTISPMTKCGDPYA